MFVAIAKTAALQRHGKRKRSLARPARRGADPEAECLAEEEVARLSRRLPRLGGLRTVR